jgi:acyl-CoA thioester hydrolase
VILERRPVAAWEVPAIYEHRHTVAADEIDELGHASNIVYLQWTQAAAVAHSSLQGWTPEAYRRLGMAFIARSHRIEYLRPALAGDELLIRTWVADFRSASSTRKYEVLRASDGAVLATAETVWAFIKLDTGRPTRIPPEIQAAFQIVER